MFARNDLEVTSGAVRRGCRIGGESCCGFICTKSFWHHSENCGFLEDELIVLSNAK